VRQGRASSSGVRRDNDDSVCRDGSTCTTRMYCEAGFHYSMCGMVCRLLALEQEKRQLQQKLQDPAAAGRVPLAETQSLRDNLTRVTRENQRLQEELEEAQQRVVEAEEAAAARAAGLQRSLALAEEARVAQASELAARPTVQALDDLRREVQALQALQFGSLDVAVAEEGGAGGSAGLERAAAARVRTLEHQITVRRAHSLMFSSWHSTAFAACFAAIWANLFDAFGFV